MDTYRFRLVVRGTTPEGKRVRRVRTVELPTYEQAWSEFGEQHAQAMAEGLDAVAYQVLPPVGWRLDGTVSRGYETA